MLKRGSGFARSAFRDKLLCPWLSSRNRLSFHGCRHFTARRRDPLYPDNPRAPELQPVGSTASRTSLASRARHREGDTAPFKNTRPFGPHAQAPRFVSCLLLLSGRFSGCLGRRWGRPPAVGLTHGCGTILDLIQ